MVQCQIDNLHLKAFNSHRKMLNYLVNSGKEIDDIKILIYIHFIQKSEISD